MPEFGYEKYQKMVKNLGKKEPVEEQLPYGEIVRDTWKGTLQIENQIISTHVIPSGQQLKLLFLRVWSEYNGTTIFKIVQVNPAAAGQTGATEAYPVLGSAPAGIIDYPMLEAPGAEILGPQPLDAPVHVLEGSVYIKIQDPTPTLSSDAKFGLAWWGVED